MRRIRTTQTAMVIAAIGAFAFGPIGCDGSVSDPVEAAPSMTSVAEEPAGEVQARSTVASSSAQLGVIKSVLSAFHGALNASDYQAIRAIWTEDATLSAFGQTASGPTEIADFFATSGPFVNGWAALAPTYETEVEIKGNTATYAFECVYVPDTGNLAGQTVVAHLNASGTLRKVGDRWLFDSFVGGVGPLP